jgi:hypothetical protein
MAKFGHMILFFTLQDYRLVPFHLSSGREQHLESQCLDILTTLDASHSLKEIGQPLKSVMFINLLL